MSAEDRDAYVREVTTVAAPDARLLLVEFTPGGTIAVPGIGQDEIERRFTPGWTLLAAGDQPYEANRYSKALRSYLLQRTP
jgi:hypothetical protein